MWAGRRACRCLVASLLGAAWITVSKAYKLDPNSTDSIRSISLSIADDMIDTYYFGHLPGNTPGILPQPYYWWEAGALMGAMIDYWYYTGDTKFNNLTSQALLAQVGELNDYMPRAQIMNEGNDDQGFWGVAVMAAAEYKFPDPPKDKPQWLALAQAVFNTQASRWDTDHCGGGLRWQIFQWNNGYDYKNTISQACFFNIASRLALYTNNQTYADWADRVWDWTMAVGFIDKETYWIRDGAHIPNNCTTVVPYLWTYNTGAFMHGAAAMYNYSTGARREVWRDRLDRLVDMSKVFFNGTNGDIMSEVACETVSLCNVDQQSFKAYLARWMAATTKWAPWTINRIMPLLRSTAVAAAELCTGGTNGRMCGHRWYDGKFDGLTGLGQQMSVLEVVLGLMSGESSSPATEKTGGTSVGDPAAGGSDMGNRDPKSLINNLPPMSAGERAGAYVLTVAALLGLAAGVAFVMVDETDKRSWPERWSDLRTFIIRGGGISGAGGAVIAATAVLKKKTSSTLSQNSGQNDSKKNGTGSGNGGEVVVLSDSDASMLGAAVLPGGREKQASSRRFLSKETSPRLFRPSSLAPDEASQRHQPDLRNVHRHRKARSMPAWDDPELGIARGIDPGPLSGHIPMPPSYGSGSRLSAPQFPRASGGGGEGTPSSAAGRNTLKKKGEGAAASHRPASMAA